MDVSMSTSSRSGAADVVGVAADEPMSFRRLEEAFDVDVEALSRLVEE
jgi:hypothetical protein